MLKPNNRNERKELSWAFLIPLIAAVVFVPLIVRIHMYDPKLSDYGWFSMETDSMDVFHYWKNFFLSIIGGILLCLLMGLALAEGKLQIRKMFIPLGIYAIMCILSTFFSVSRYHSIHGFYEMFESIFCLLSYCLICYYSYAVLRTERSLRTMAIWILIGVALLGIIGTSQFFNKDLIMSKIGRDLILPDSYGEDYGLYPKKLELTFGAGRVYCTQYNPNYVGVYTAMIMPLLLVLAVTVDKAKKLLVYIPLIIVTAFSLVGSLSRTGMIALIGSAVLILVMFHHMILKYWKQSIGVIAILVVGIIVFDFSRDHVISQRFMSIFVTSEEESKEEFHLKHIDLQDDQYVLEYNGEKLNVINKIEMMEGENGESVPAAIYPIVTKEDGTQVNIVVMTEGEGEQMVQYYALEGDQYAGLRMQPALGGMQGDIYGIQIQSDGYNYFIFYSDEDSTYYYQNIYGRAVKMVSSETADWGIFKMFGGISGRGYIWSKTIPMLKDYLFLGSGPDTYTIAFPQSDYISLNQGGYSSQIITKPHSMYLQTAVQTGMVSLIAWLVFYGWYFVESWKLYFRKEYTMFSEKLGLGIMIATASFMISGIANDSNPSTSPVYWGLMGVGIAANTVVQNTRAEVQRKKEIREQAIANVKTKAEAQQKKQNNEWALTKAKAEAGKETK